MIGSLSPDQARLVDQLAGLTGWEPGVLATWVGTVSGWGRHRPDHNYVGPGREVYRSTDHAAARATTLLGAPRAVRGAAVAGPHAQLAQIDASPLPGRLDDLQTTYRQLGASQAASLLESETGLRARILTKVAAWLS